MFNRRVADHLDLTMNGMSHAGEFVKLIDENGWRVAEGTGGESSTRSTP